MIHWAVMIECGSSPGSHCIFHLIEGVVMAEKKAPQVSEAPVPQEETKNPLPNGVKDALEWLKKVDDFEVKGYKNKLPRWSFVVAILAILAI